jgi:predicted RNA-binding protein YlqC (UPF0109 family)
MKDFLKYLVSFIVTNPEEIEIQEKQEEGINIYTIVIPEEEVGKVIGKGGKVINSIRCLARIKAIKNQERVLVKVEANQNGLSLPTTTPEENSSAID